MDKSTTPNDLTKEVMSQKQENGQESVQESTGGDPGTTGEPIPPEEGEEGTGSDDSGTANMLEAAESRMEMDSTSRRSPPRPRPRPRPRYNTFIKLSAKGPIYLYKNRKLIKYFSRPGRLYGIRLNTKKGDVIGFSAYMARKRFGYIAVITRKGKHHYTGISRNFRTEPWVSKHSKLLVGYHRKGFKRGCLWRNGFKTNMGPKFKFPRRASYIWSYYNKRPWSRVVTRFVIGGEDCKPKGRTCKCRRVKNVRSFCFDMRNKRRTHGRCNKRKCAHKYVCVPRGGKHLPTCIMRFAHYKVIKKSMRRGKKFCARLKIDPPTKFWVPY